MKKILIAGASGFIGKYLIESLLNNTDYEIIALSRNEKESHHPRLVWKKCDLFSVFEIEQVLGGVDLVFYLVHSMQPSAKLDQASFNDYDLILSDNFGRAARKCNVKKVIYLSGIIPQNEKLSEHLLSRLEVEEVLKEYFLEFSILRAGLILGKDGSSFNILSNLVKRLPVVICPFWAENITSPVHFTTVIDSLIECIDAKYNGRTLDLASKDNVSYFKLLEMTAKSLGLKRIFLKFPYNINSISRLWVSFFSGASKRLVYPLLESLSHDMAPRLGHQIPSEPLMSVEQAIDQVVESSRDYKYKFSNYAIKRKTVRSVQRFLLPQNMNAKDLAKEYMSWLPRFLSPFLLIEIINNKWVYFSLFHRKLRLLTMLLSDERSTDDRQLFYIKGGLLASKNDKGRLEFRSVLGGKYALGAIHEFKPSLPWYIYRYTQAIVHLYVMKAFNRHLVRLSKESK
jgi:nucleoside-diphosphate-sugar epimerase